MIRRKAGPGQIGHYFLAMRIPDAHVTAFCQPSAFLSVAAKPEAVAIKLESRHLFFRYGKTTALRDISFPLFANRVTSIIGPSGCGKSTLLRIFNRLYELYADQHVEGEVLLEGKNILARDVDVHLLRARIGMVAQKPAPFPTSIFKNISFGLQLYDRRSPEETAAQVELALKQAALWNEVKDRLAESGLELSGGQQQRLCIARTIAVQPEVILFDEPCSAVDPIATAQIEQTIAELKVNHTIAIVTHNLEQAARVSDYTAFLYLGELIEFGATADIFLRPRKEQTQQYVTGRFG